MISGGESMNINECAEQLRRRGFKAYCWKPDEHTAEPDIVAEKGGRFYNVYLERITSREAAAEEFAKAHGAKVLYLA
jgi:hypothetical protein